MRYTVRPIKVLGALLAVATVSATGLAIAQDLVITGGKVYPAPGTAPIENAAVLVRNGRIAAVAEPGSFDVGDDATVLDARGSTVMAGFWNSHVHFTEPKWMEAAGQPAARLQAQLREMLVRYCFTSVVDTGSDPRNTGPLRARIESGEVAGPRILMAMSPLYPPDGVPYYVRDALPPEVLPLLSQPASAEQAAALVRANLDGDGDVVKLFTGSWVQQGGAAKPMPVAIATAAVAEAHRRRALVFSHPSDVAGLDVALEAGVDVLAHAVEQLEGFERAHLQRMRDQNVAMVPTLKLFSINPKPKLDAIVRQVGDYQRLGGSIWFGTDVGYDEDYDPALEFELLGRAGLSFDQILAALTTAPASRLPGGSERGRIEPGLIADLVILDGDPAQDRTAWTRPRHVLRGGRIIFAADEAAR